MIAECRRRLNASVTQAWCAFDRATELPSRVTPAAPILFFGNLDAYCASPLRLLTVGLNPSLHEFPTGEPFQRFPFLIGTSTDREPGRYLDAMSDYFRTDPYRKWFDRALEPLLNGAGASYYAGETSTALHTDICSPVATNPTAPALNSSVNCRRARRGLSVAAIVDIVSAFRNVSAKPDQAQADDSHVAVLLHASRWRTIQP